jgi:Flp pilus assembly protein TadG
MTLPSFLHRRRRDRRAWGQSVVEFALVLPLFLLLTIGVVDMARVFSGYVSLTNGVREAALYASLTSDLPNPNYANWCPTTTTMQCPAGNRHDPDSIGQRVRDEASGLDQTQITISSPTCTANPSASPVVYTACGLTSQWVKIGASYRMPLLTPILSSILGNGVTMSFTETAQIFR